MNKGWLELESDPGLFTLLLQDFGVKGVQVEEIYDLQKTIDGPVYGFIFLFRWIEERRSRRKTITEEEAFVSDENIVNSIYFAKQNIPNSCATHALLSVLLNCEKVTLGSTLSKLKHFSRHMNPENKGFAIGNIPELAKAHNSHARQEPAHLPEKQQGMTVKTMEAFHFVSYVPINGRLFELDGLKPYPIDHGPWDKCEDWTEKFRRVITERLGMATGGEPYHDIRFNLMAVVPDKCQLYDQKLSTLKTNRQIVLEALEQMVRMTNPGLTAVDKEKCIAAVRKRGQLDTLKVKDCYMDVSGAAPSTSRGDKSRCDNQSSVKGDSKTAVQTSAIVPSNSGSRSVVCESKVKIDLNEGRHETKMEGIETGSQSATQTLPVSVPETTTVNQSSLSDSVIDSKNALLPVSSGSGKSCTVTVLPPPVSTTTDVTKPLTIETKFSSLPGPGSESTDTASEVGSCFSSPSSTITSCENSPNVCSEGIDGATTGTNSKKTEKDVTDPSSSSSSSTVKSKTKFSSHQGFKPRDLLALLKNVENEISLCEANLKDEQEKMNKYKIDDCRRTHNYDQFLCTFLSMLAEQGLLADLVQQHSLIKKRLPVKITANRVTKLSAQADKRKRAKPKRRR